MPGMRIDTGRLTMNRRASLGLLSGRTPRGRDELATLIDYSVVVEARALLERQGKLPA